MEEKFYEAPMEQKVDLDLFFQTGYVIELEEGIYYQKQKDGKVICSSLSGAKRFPRRKDAELFAFHHLGYVDLKVILCRVGWVLLSLDSEFTECEQYWDGYRFTSDGEKALVFSSFQKAKDFQKKSGLLVLTMIDLRAFRKSEIIMAA